MGSNSQRSKERHKRKRQKKKKEQLRTRQREIQRTGEVAVGSNVRHRQRLAQQTPKAWAGEAPEDVAVFDDSVLESLPPELASQVAVIRQALQDASELRGEDALNRVSTIPRSSPLSQWRLFIRGLVGWLADDAEAASEAWKRLDPQRRPGRIAVAMMTALQPDLDRASQPRATQAEGADGSDNETPIPWWSRQDDQLLYHAKLLRRIRFDRPAIRTAEAGLRLPAESRKLLLGPRRIQWLKSFIAEHRETEPDLAAALAQAALGRAFAQNYGDLFEEAARVFEGPRHDHRNLLLSFFYFRRFKDDQPSERRAQRALDEYLTNALPRNEALSAPLRNAIASQIHLNEAMGSIRLDGRGMMERLFAAPADPKVIRKLLNASVKAYPANRAAYKAHVEWIESRLDEGRLTKPKRKPLEEELAQVMRNWSQALPDDARPRLWLVDYLLENESTEEARPHVDWMAASRQDDPRVRATPWKWELLEAMRLCRRTAWLADVPARLDEAERLWPSWLSRHWLPYLKAAWTLRSGHVEAFEQQRGEICQESGLARDSLTDACMMLGAAQLMRVPAASLKPLRAPVDTAVKSLEKLPLDEFLSASDFFWDLHRTQLLYPAYRMHGGKIAKELQARLAKAHQSVLNRVNDEAIHKAVLWCSEHRFWGNGYEFKLPHWYSNPAVRRHPMFVAARLNAFLKLRFHWDCKEYREFGPLLREAAQSQPDAYYRHWFVSLADELDDVLASESSRSFGFGSGFNPFSDMFGASQDDETDDEETDEDEFDNDLDFDPNCDCPDCRAAQRAYEAKR